MVILGKETFVFTTLGGRLFDGATIQGNTVSVVIKNLIVCNIQIQGNKMFPLLILGLRNLLITIITTYFLHNLSII